ncbi:MAG: lytic murein transglycosylase [Thiobacillaceae bacterium]|nr:lytic murein transglycosylase [Thiobacillaceae bacterium]MCX7672049.1 lytic murein transglycosylase [Thiobacillaceae bacterium]MDW8323813.1 lytic murein transglycosylase [Burkholderiales bacterium]
MYTHTRLTPLDHTACKWVSAHLDPFKTLLVVLLAALSLFAAQSTLADEPSPAATARTEDFQTWLARLRQEAIGRGISATTFDRALMGVVPDARVVELDRRQPEFLEPFLDYLERRVTPARVEEGRRRLSELRELLASLQQRYGIPPHLLVALWGLETDYGGHLGQYAVPAALATLAYEGRRGAFFRAQLLDALAILEEGHIEPEAMRGSWAGAMGQLQFMPSTFRAYAVDADGDGRKDLWRSLPDAFASAAHYLRQLGWQTDEPWGREVRLPADFDWALASPGLTRPVSAWAALGVTQADGQPLPPSNLPAALLLPQGHKGPAFLVHTNFNLLLAWNRSHHYALAVGILADRLRGLPGLLNGQQARHPRLSRRQIIDLQRQLQALGHDAGEIDGVLGPRTRAAIRAFQRAEGLPADGYASPELLRMVELRALTGPHRPAATAVPASAPVPDLPAAPVPLLLPES